MPEDQNINPVDRPTVRIPTPQERIDLAASYRARSNNAPIPSFRIDKSIALENRLVNAAESIAITNVRIMTNMDEMKSVFSKFAEDQKVVNQIRTDASSGSVEHAATTAAHRQQLIDPRDLTDAQRIRALGRAERLRGKSFEEQAKGLAELNPDWTFEQGQLRIGDQQYAGEHLQNALNRITGKAQRDTMKPEEEKLASSVEQGLLNWSRAAKDTIPERLAGRGLGVWDFANPANLIKNVGGVVAGHHMPHGVFSPRTPTTVPGRVGAATEGGVEAGALRSAAGPLERLMAGAGVGGLASRLALGVIPGIGEVALGAYAATQLGQHIPGVRNLLRGRQELINLETQGALTGEGRGAGLAAFREARDLRGGIIGSQFHGLLHPFDPITNQIATEIVTSVRTQGFTGRQGRDFQRQVASLYRDLRLPIDQTTQLLTDAVRTGGESLGQIANEMHTFDDAAHSLQMNINEYAQNIATAAKSLRDAGAGGAATQFAQSLLASLPRSMRTAEGIGAVQTSMQAAAPFITAQTGVPFWQQGLERNIPSTRAAYERTLVQQFRLMPGRDDAERAAAAAQFSPIFRGMSIPQILQMVDRIQHGRGPGSVAVIEQTRQRYSNQLTRLGRPGTMTGLEIIRMGRDQARSLGVSDAEWARIHADARINRGWVSHQYQTRAHLDISRVPTAQLAAIRQDALNQVQGVLTKQQYSDLEKHIGDRKYAFDAQLRNIESARGRFTGGSSVDVNGVTITLKGKAAKHFDLNAPNTQAVASGRMPANQQYFNESSRLNTGW